MPPLSDRQHDAFDNAAKTACREGNLRVLREADFGLPIPEANLFVVN